MVPWNRRPSARRGRTWCLLLFTIALLGLSNRLLPSLWTQAPPAGGSGTGAAEACRSVPRSARISATGKKVRSWSTCACGHAKPSGPTGW